MFILSDPKSLCSLLFSSLITNQGAPKHPNIKYDKQKIQRFVKFTENNVKIYQFIFYLHQVLHQCDFSDDPLRDQLSCHSHNCLRISHPIHMTRQPLSRHLFHLYLFPINKKKYSTEFIISFIYTVILYT